MRDIAVVLKPCQYCLFRKDWYRRSLEVFWTCSLLGKHVQECTYGPLPSATCRRWAALCCVALPAAA
jgi:hypothetical protein